jgi:serine/threonine-protein kinase
VTAEGAPSRFGKYEVKKTLGAGAMGVVYLAYDPAIDRNVALKTIRKDLLGSRHAASMIARFRQEAVAAGRLSHPGIVAVYDYGEDESTAYIVMEYVPGHDLESYLEGRLPTLAEVGAVMAQLLDALQCAHDAGVVHRDIKPSNLLVHGRLKITDFGIARLGNAKLTNQGTAVGTPSYMAPEQYTGAAVDHRVDLFASGVLFYEMLTGALPFEGTSVQEIGYKVCYVEPAPPTTLRPDLPRAVDAIVSRALAKSPDQRFPSARDFARAVADALSFAESHDALSTTEPAPVPPPAAPAPAPQGGTITAWKPELVRALEAALVPFVGALAGPLVRRSCAKTSDPGELVTLLGDGAGDAGARAQLTTSLRVVLGMAPPPPPAASPPRARTVPIPPAAAAAAAPRAATVAAVPTIGERLRAHTREDLDRVTQALAGFVGPIAKIFVQKAAADVKGYHDLCVRVSERLSTPEERERFLKQVGG